MVHRLSALVSALVLLGSAVAHAAPVTVAYDPSGGALVTGTPDADKVFVSLEGTEEAPVISVESGGGGVAGRGCSAVALVVRCVIAPGGSQALTVNLADGDDVLEVIGLPAIVNLGAGNDRLRQSSTRMVANLGPGDDVGGLGAGGGTISGGDGDDAVAGGPAQDTLDGGPGNDRLLGSLGADTLEGGPGTDRADYLGLMTPTGALPTLRVGFDTNTATKRAGGGTAGADQLVSLEGARGTPRGDLLRGGPGVERLDGAAGQDTITSREGRPDTIVCGDGADVVDLDLTDKVPDAPTCEQSSRGAVDEVPNVVFGAARPIPGASAWRVSLRCPTATRAVGCRGGLRVIQGARQGKQTPYSIKAGRSQTVRVTLPDARAAATVIRSVERGRLGERTTYRVYAKGARAAQNVGGVGNDLAPIGQTGEDVAEFRVTCGAINRYVTGFSGRASLRLRPFGLRQDIDGVRALQPFCATMLEDGRLTASVLEGTLGERLGGDGLFNVRAPEFTKQCQLFSAITGTTRFGVANGIFAEVAEREDPIYIRSVGLECAFAEDLDPVLNDIGSPVVDDGLPERIDATSTCPPGMALTGLRAGGDRLGRTADFLSYAAICSVFPRPPAAPRALKPGSVDTVELVPDAKFTWRGAGAAYLVCVTSVLPQRCARTTQKALPIGELLRGSDVGTRFTWAVRSCAAGRSGRVPDRACGRFVNVPGVGGIVSGVRLVPRPPVPISSSRPRGLASGRILTVGLRFTGGAFATGHRATVSVGTRDLVDRRFPEGLADLLTARTVDVSAAVPAGRQVVTFAVRSCGGNPDLPPGATRAEVCGPRIPMSKLLVDVDARVCAVGTTVPTACPRSGSDESVAGQRG